MSPTTGAPTDNYDIRILDQHGLDVLQGVGANRDLMVSEEAAIVYSGTSLHPRVDLSDTLTLAIANNVVASAVIVIDLYYSTGG